VHESTGTLPAPTRTATERGYAAWLAEHRPDLHAGFLSALPGARAAVLARLWGALAREPLPGLTARAERAGELTVTVAGHSVHGPAAAARPFATPAAGLRVGGHEHPADLAARLWPRSPGFVAELDNSVANLALARAATAPGGEATHDPVDAEQSIVDGHPLHPCCRTRLGFGPADVLAYAPEHRPMVALPLVGVPAGRWYTTGAGLPPTLPVHPWQWARLRERHPDLRSTGATLPGRPLMALRTFAVPGWHLKTAIDVQATSAVRTVSAAAVHNGPACSALVAHLTRRTPWLRVLREPAAGAVLVDGVPCRQLAVVRREPPRPGPGERVLPLAALTAGRPRAVELIRQGYAGAPGPFLADLAALLLPPLLTLLALGVALEAHGQNLLLVATGGRPTRLLYRDFGGVRISPARLARNGIEAPPLHGDVRSDEPEVLRTKVFAAAVATVLAELVVRLATGYGEEPATLWAAVASTVPANGPDAQALYDATLPLKAMTAMRLANTVEDRWATVPNPLADRQP